MNKEMYEKFDEYHLKKILRKSKGKKEKKEETDESRKNLAVGTWVRSYSELRNGSEGTKILALRPNSSFT